MREWDLIVVGGGPAGAVLATLAARDGLNVLLLERKARGRDKVCGGVLAPLGARILTELGLTQAVGAKRAHELKELNFTTPLGRNISAPMSPPSFSLSRTVLDGGLIAEAERAGAIVRERSAVYDVAFDHEKWCVAVSKPDRTSRDLIKGAWLIAADGAFSTVLGLARLGRDEPRRRREPIKALGLQSRWELARQQARALAHRLELHVLRGGYAGLCLTEVGTAHLCLYVKSEKRSVSEILRTNAALCQRLAGARQLGRWKGIRVKEPGRLSRPAAHPPHPDFLDSPYGDLQRRLFTVGDAAARVSPFLGLGITHAVYSAALVAHSIRRVARRGEVNPLGAPHYKAWTRERITSSHLLGLALHSAPLAELAWVIAVLFPWAVRSLVSRLHSYVGAAQGTPKRTRIA